MARNTSFNFLIMQFSSAPYNFLHARSKYSPQQPLLEHPRSGVLGRTPNIKLNI